MNPSPPPHPKPKSAFFILVGLALLKLLLHLITNLWGGYGIFRDELYYIACSEHLDFGYVDQPPLSIYLLAAHRGLFGDSLFALRFLPALAGAATVFLTGLLAQELGGRRFALVLASVASIASTINLAMSTIYSMNGFDILLWASAAYVLIRLIKTGDPRHWLSLGLILGLGLLNKTGVLWLAFGIFIAVLLTPLRHSFKTKWPYLGGLIALVLFLPYLLWNFAHDWAHLEFIRNATTGKYSELSPLTFSLGQVLVQNPITFPLWLAGLLLVLFSKDAKRFRALGYTYLAVFVILLVNRHSKAEYLSPAYAMLFAAGGVAFERLASQRYGGWLKPVSLAVLIVGGIVLAPVTLPILPVQTYIRYAHAFGIKPHTSEARELGELPQFYADMFGWKEKAAAVAAVYNTLSPEEKAKCALFADNYGRCAAIDFFGKAYGLPKSIGPHNNYWIWGPRNYTGELVIILGGALEDIQEVFEKVEVVGTVTCPYCMPYENNLRIYVCRNLKVPLKELWAQLRHFD